MTKQDPGAKLEDRLTSLGLPGDRRGDARDRSELLAVTPGTLKHWLTGRNAVPRWVWCLLTLYSMAGADVREKYRRWCRERADADNYEPD